MQTGDIRQNGHDTPLDAVIVGAGFAGMYMLYRLRGLGFTARVFEAGSGVGGTWYWNRYPGARVDVPSIDYMYSFDPEWSKEWQWSEKYATQPEILRYLHYVADKHDLRRDVQFSTKVEQAIWHADALLWEIRTNHDETVTCRFCVMAAGCLSTPKRPEIEGVERFGGDIYFTSRWPHERVDFTGQRVAVIGTGSSGIQSIPVIATEAAQLTVFQRTANYSVPAHNGPVSPEQLSLLTQDEAQYREAARLSPGGIPRERSMTMTFSVSEVERRARYERAWETGELFEFVGVYADVLADRAANDELAEFVRDKIRSVVKDPETAEALCPTGYPIGCKRLCLDTNCEVGSRRGGSAPFPAPPSQTGHEVLPHPAFPQAVGPSHSTKPPVLATSPSTRTRFSGERIRGRIAVHGSPSHPSPVGRAHLAGGPSLRRVVLSTSITATMPSSDFRSTLHHFTGSPLIGFAATEHRRSATCGHNAGAETDPSCSMMSCTTVPPSIRRRVPGCCTSKVFTPSMAFAPVVRARLPLFPWQAGGG